MSNNAPIQTNTIQTVPNQSYSIDAKNIVQPDYTPIALTLSSLLIITILICGTCLYITNKRNKIQEKELEVKQHELDIEEIKLKLKG